MYRVGKDGKRTCIWSLASVQRARAVASDLLRASQCDPRNPDKELLKLAAQLDECADKFAPQDVAEA